MYFPGGLSFTAPTRGAHTSHYLAGKTPRRTIRCKVKYSYAEIVTNIHVSRLTIQ
jgi:hypothetical protein